MLNFQSNKKTTGLYLILLWAMKIPKNDFFSKNLIVEKAINVEKSV